MSYCIEGLLRELLPPLSPSSEDSGYLPLLSPNDPGIYQDTIAETEESPLIGGTIESQEETSLAVVHKDWAMESIRCSTHSIVIEATFRLADAELSPISLYQCMTNPLHPLIILGIPVMIVNFNEIFLDTHYLTSVWFIVFSVNHTYKFTLFPNSF